MLGKKNKFPKREKQNGAAYLLVLVGGDGRKDCFGEAERFNALPARHWFVSRQLTAGVLPDDVNPRLILVHGVKDDL